MSEFFTEAAKQVPSLGVLVFVVHIFLKHLKEIAAANSESFRQINDANLEAREATRETLKHCADVIEKNTAAVARMNR